MFLRNARVLAPLLALVMLLCGLSGCGANLPSQSGAPTVTRNLPDNLRIAVIMPDPTQNKKPQVTLHVVSRVQQFYRTLLALPLMSQSKPCTEELGPHYDLTFLRGTQTVTHALARREGCRPVTISGEAQDRQASQDFWDQLDQAILAATPA